MSNEEVIKKVPSPLSNGEVGHLGAFVGSLKAAVSAIVAVVACNGFHLPQAAWAAISAVIVTQPGVHPSARASLLRVAANLIGAFAGAAVNSVLGHSIWAMGVGILLTGLICHCARLDDALRPAFAALVIVMFLDPDGAWHQSLGRVLAVLVGCAASLFVAAIYGLLTARFQSRRPPQEEAPQSTE